MARKEIILDDLDGSPDASTLSFALGDQKWEIDLSPANAERLAKVLQPFVNNAREVTKPAKSDTGQSSAVRVWAKQHNIELSPKGKVPQNIVDQYEAWKADEINRREAESQNGAKPAAAPAPAPVPAK